MKNRIFLAASFFWMPFLLTDIMQPHQASSKNEYSLTIKPEYANDLDQEWIRSSHGNNVHVYKMKSDGSEVGHSVWIKRKEERANAKYFAFKEQNDQKVATVYDRFRAWKVDKDIVLVCSGAFSTELPGTNNRNAITVGLTVDNGRIVNRNIEYSMDGLVIVYATGGIVVSDIENKNLKIGNINISVIDDKTKLLDWAVKNKATIFQTQLLAYQNTLRISRAGRKEARERRFLVLAQSPSEGLYHIVFNLPQNNYLFDAARDIFYFLKERKKMEVVAILNLDTGAYNVMELYKDNEQQDLNIRGDTDVKVSTNLIVYHYSK